MRYKVKFKEQSASFKVEFNSLQPSSVGYDDGYEAGYSEGYAQGEQIGKEEGYRIGEVSGFENAKKMLTTLSVTKNGEYLPQGENIGFKSVSANVDTSEAYQEGFSKGIVDGYNNAIANLTTLTATANGEYTPPSGKIGFKKVSVSIPSDAKTEQEKSKTITKNGSYEILPDSGKVLRKVTVTANIPERKEEQEKTANITSNGSVVVLPDTGKVLSKVTLNVAVPEKLPVLQDKEITENGTYTADDGYDGFGTITVNVPQTGGGEDTEENWLFKDEYIDEGYSSDLPSLSAGVSYTAFVNGEEISTVVANEWGDADFINQDKGVYLQHLSYQGWYFDTTDSWATTSSGTVSIRINEEQSGGGWTLTDVESPGDVYIENRYIYANYEPCYVADNDGNSFNFDPANPLELSLLDSAKTYGVWNDIGGNFIANLVYR